MELVLFHLASKISGEKEFAARKKTQCSAN